MAFENLVKVWRLATKSLVLMACFGGVSVGVVYGNTISSMLSLGTAEDQKLTVTFAKVNKRSYAFMDFNLKAFNDIGLFHMLDGRNLRAVEDFNRALINKSRSKSLVDRLLLISRAQVLVYYQTGAKDWIVFYQDGSVKQVKKVPKPGSVNAQALHRWLTKALGFNAKIIASDGDLRLAAAPQYLLTTGRQAVLQKVITLNGKSQAYPYALMEIQETQSGLALLKKILPLATDAEIKAKGANAQVSEVLVINEDN